MRAARWSRIVGAGAAVTFVVACPSSAAAQPAPSPADVATAKRHFESGLKLHKEGLFREALASFVRANQLAPRASLLRNIAQCHRDLKDFAAAYETYAELLAKYGASMRPADTASVKQAFEELALLTGTIRVSVAEPAAAVRVDGRDAGTTPLASPVRVNIGAHRIEIAKTGFETIAREVTLRGNDEIAVSGPLERDVPTGHLAVTLDRAAGEPALAGVHVFVDGKDVGAAPWEGDLAPGPHEIEARGATAFAPGKRVEIARRSKLAVVLAVEVRVGRLQVDPHDVDAQIAVDGALVGRGVWEGALPLGRHELTITMKGFDLHRRAFLVHAGETVVEDVHLRAAAQPVVVPVPSYRGLYSQLHLFGVASPVDATHAIAESCPAPPCTTSNPIGAGLGVRVGHSWGFFAVEGALLGMYDTSSASVTYRTDVASGAHAGVARTEDYRFHRFGGGGAVGARLMSKHPNVRFTFGAALGVERKGNIYTRDATALAADSSGRPPKAGLTGETVSYTAPIVLFDVGVMMGPASGLKFFVGGMMLLELVGDPVLAPASDTRVLGEAGGQPAKLGTPALQVASGTQVFIGPVLGIHFGP